MNGQRKFILVPAGSSGDIYPFVWLGKGLASLGHEVVVVVHRPFDRTMEAAGLRTLGYGTDEDFEQIMRHPDLWHPRRGFELIALLAPRLYPEIVSRVNAEIAPGRTLLVGAGIAFGARIAAEAFKVPLVTVQLQPAVFLSPEDPPVPQAGMEWFRKAPRWLRRLLYRVGYFRTDRLLAGASMRTGPNSVSTIPCGTSCATTGCLPSRCWRCFRNGTAQSRRTGRRKRWSHASRSTTTAIRLPCPRTSRRSWMPETRRCSSRRAPRTCRRAVSSRWDWRPAGGSVSGPCS